MTFTNIPTRFNENECVTQITPKFNLDSLVEKEEQKLKILDAIKTFKERKESLIETINGFSGTFPSLRLKYVNQVDTYNRCINRLYFKYQNL